MIIPKCLLYKSIKYLLYPSIIPKYLLYPIITPKYLLYPSIYYTQLLYPSIYYTHAFETTKLKNTNVKKYQRVTDSPGQHY